MQFLDKTLESSAANVALDEALLETAELAGPTSEWLRIWEPQSPMVVVGRSSSVTAEVNLAKCEQDGVPVLRRSSGGATIVAAPGCLMYAVVLSVERRPQLQAIDQAHRLVLGRLLDALTSRVALLSESGVCESGICDLVIGDRKVSGNALRCRRTHVLYHGTLLYDMPLALISRYLRMPQRQPDYRNGRGHDDFVANLNVGREELSVAVREAWGNPPSAANWPEEMVARLVEEKYSRDDWNRRIE